MFNIFGRRKKNELIPDNSSKSDKNEQALLIDITLDGSTELGTREERRAIEELEEGIKKLLPKGSELDGHGFGEGECNIFIYGANADEMFKSIENYLKKSSFDHIEICLRYGSVEDMDALEKKFSL